MNKYVKWSLIGCGGLTVIGILLIVVLAFGIGASIIGSDSTTSSSTESTKENKKKIYQIGDTVSIGDLEYKILNLESQNVIKDSLGNEYRPGAGKYLILEIQIKNVGKEKITADSNMFKLKDPEGAEYTADPQVDTWINESGGDSLGFFLKPINPNATKTGKVAFDVPNKPAETFTFEGQGGIFSLDEPIQIQLKK